MKKFINQLLKRKALEYLAQILNHDLEREELELYDERGNKVFKAWGSTSWCVYKYDANNNQIYREFSNGNWIKSKYNSNNKKEYYKTSENFWCKITFRENSDGIKTNYNHWNRPKNQ